MPVLTSRVVLPGCAGHQERGEAQAVQKEVAGKKGVLSPPKSLKSVYIENLSTALLRPPPLLSATSGIGPRARRPTFEGAIPHVQRRDSPRQVCSMPSPAESTAPHTRGMPPDAPLHAIQNVSEISNPKASVRKQKSLRVRTDKHSSSCLNAGLNRLDVPPPCSATVVAPIRRRTIRHKKKCNIQHIVPLQTTGHQSRGGQRAYHASRLEDFLLALAMTAAVEDWERP
eukprot:1765186-Rhodomonas_salina.2